MSVCLSTSERAALAMAWLEPCLLCGTRPISVAALFVPDAAFTDRLGVRAGSTIAYALCQLCLSFADVAEMVEAEILERRAA